MQKGADFTVIGKREPRVEGVLKATGQAMYAGDLVFPGMLYGRILRSPYPHARILNIDTGRAAGLRGVKAVITGKDTPGIRYGVRVDLPRSWDEYPLAMDKVRYIGDEVAAVAAISEDIAEEALDLIDVEYEELPAVFDPEKAMEPQAPRIHDYAENNICMERALNFGDVERAFKESYLIREETFTTQAVNHVCLETHAAVGLADSSGKITIWASTVGPWVLRYWLAHALGIRESMIRVIKPHVGGSFGSKAELFPLEFCVALLSKKTGKPVKIVHTREEEFATRKRHPARIHLKMGVEKDGTLKAVDCSYILDTGAYSGTGTIVLQLSSIAVSSGPYRIPNVSYRSRLVYTNNCTAGAMRGLGAVQTNFAMDSLLDCVAHDLGMDPMEIRLKNARQPGEVTGDQCRITSCGLTECIETTKEMSGWQRREEGLPPYEGTGMACGSYYSGVAWPFNASAAFVQVHQDGGVSLLTGASDAGQGSDTVLCQIVAEELGVRLEDIRITSADTELTPPDPGTYSSRVTFLAGNAVKRAAADARKQILELVAEKLEANPEDLEAKDRRIHVKGDPDRGMSFVDAVQYCLYSDNKTLILGRGFYTPPTFLGGGNLSPAYSFGSQVAKVIVDRETGRIRCVKAMDAHDCGRALNPMAVEGQLEGSVSGGEGQALYEDYHMDQGLMLNPSLLEYKIPTSLEVPEMEAVLVETVDPEGPFGAKEAGEGPQVSPVPAIANAIFNATGVRIKDLPITPHRLLEAMEKTAGKNGIQ